MPFESEPRIPEGPHAPMSKGTGGGEGGRGRQSESRAAGVTGDEGDSRPARAYEGAAGVTGDEGGVRLVQLRGGLTVFLAAIELMLDLERRGYRITRQGGDLVVAPRAGLTAADLDALRAHKADCLLLADYTEAR